MGIGRREFLKQFGVGVAALGLGSDSALAIFDDWYVNNDLGIAFRKPTGWAFNNIATVSRMHQEQQVQILDRLDSEATERWLANSKAPVLVISREPGRNPGVTVHLSGIASDASFPWYQLACGDADIEMHSRALGEFEVLSPPSRTRVSECDAIEYTASFRTARPDETCATRMRMVAIFQCPAFYTLRMFDEPAAGPTETVNYDSFLDSVRIA